ncbi:DUF6235 family protein [Actinophytocola sp.]|jgi:hypothetical protein|uniref:DUF6235 family protein n=1 Tax=Actinophytocola sp. TaxID=1872138 RepID=UPI002ED95A0D
MNEPTECGGTIPGARFRMATGLEVLEDWASTATQARKNAIYAALFAMLDGSLFRRYRIVDDFQRPSELYAIVKDDLALKIRIHCSDSFGVVYIGPCAGVPELRRGRWRES